MGNLTRTPTRILLNSVDSETLTLLAGNLGVFVKEYGDIKTSEIQGGYKCCYCPGILKQVLIKFAPKQPCNDCNSVEIGFAVHKEFTLSGEPQVPSSFYGTMKGYYALVEHPISTGTAFLDPEDVELAVAEIMNSIGYVAYNNGAIVDAYQRIRLHYTSGTITIKITGISDGKSYTYSAASVSALVTAINTGGHVRVIAFANTGTKYLELEGPVGWGYTVTVTNLTKLYNMYSIRLVQHDIRKLFTIKAEQECTDELLIDYKQGKVYPWDVARHFPILPMSPVGMQPDLPIRGAAYCDYYFKIKKENIYDLVGANHLNDYYQEVIFSVLQSAAIGANWDTKLNTAGIFAKFDTSSCSCDSSSYNVNEGSRSESSLSY